MTLMLKTTKADNLRERIKIISLERKQPLLSRRNDNRYWIYNKSHTVPSSDYKGVLLNMSFLINQEKKGDRSNEIFIKDSAHTMAKEVTKRWDF